MSLSSFISMYALTPCHVGSGSSVGVVDNPIQRERHTNWPVIPSSGMKGAMREQFSRSANTLTTDEIFGSSNSGGSEHSGAIVISDGKILAFPMRSSIAPFVWITCPGVLKRLNKDLAWLGKSTIEIPNIQGDQAKSLIGSLTGQILLEDTIVQAEKCNSNLEMYFPNVERLLLVSDEVFHYGVSHCTAINAQIRIKSKTGTTDDGSLRYTEELPADTLMYSIIVCHNSRKQSDNSLKSDKIQTMLKNEFSYTQVGGDMTLGRGIFQLTWQ